MLPPPPGSSGVLEDNQEQGSPLQWSAEKSKEIRTKVQSLGPRKESASGVVSQDHPGIRDHQVKLLFVS